MSLTCPMQCAVCLLSEPQFLLVGFIYLNWFCRSTQFVFDACSFLDILFSRFTTVFWSHTRHGSMAHYFDVFVGVRWIVVGKPAIVDFY